MKTQKELFDRVRKLKEKLASKQELIYEEEDEFTKEVRMINKKLRDDANYIRSVLQGQTKSKQPIDTNKVMSDLEISFVQKHFDELHSDKSILDIIDRVFKGLKFFRRMDKKNRQDIILASTLKVTQPKEYIIRQGEIGSHMYIILKG